MWMEEILHQLIDGLSIYPIIYRVLNILTIRLVVQEFFHPQYLTTVE